MVERERTVYFDYLRIAAAFAVIVAHTSIINWHLAEYNSSEWFWYNFYDSISRWSVPVFVMISGALFLGRDIPCRQIYRKYISRMVTAFLFWGIVYAIADGGSPAYMAARMIDGHFHMWFLPMIVGLYMCIPFMRMLIYDAKLTKYFLILAFVFSVMLPWIIQLGTDFAPACVQPFITAINNDLSDMKFYMVIGYPSYFILGWMLNEKDLNEKQRMLIYVLGVIGFALTILLNLFGAYQTQERFSAYYDPFTLNIFFETIAVFVWFRYRKFRIEKINRFVQRLATYSFGAYLVHVLLLEQFNLKLGFSSRILPEPAGVAAVSMVVFAGSLLISAVINHIPGLRKHIC